MTERSSPRPREGRSRRGVAAVAATAVASGLLAACSAGADSGTPELVWYINPDSGGQAKVAEECSTDDYTITTQVLPQDAGQQRIQLARRLAANDPGIDLMSLDPPYTAEFANAGFLADIPDDVQSSLEEQSFEGAVASATWEDELVVFPFWSNVQVLWYRKSFVEKAGINMDEPVTWDQIIEAAEQNGGQIGVQANKYEGYAVWINALVSGAGGTIVDNTEAGVEADVTIDDEAGTKAAEIIEKLASSSAAPADLSVSNEGTAGATFGGDAGSFLVNWTYIFHNYDESAPDVAKDIGYTMYPQSVEGEDARPPYGGIGIGVSEFSEHKELALEAAECVVSPENQGINAELTGNMPASAEGYEYPALKEIYPEDLLQLFQDSLEQAAPRSVTPYWSDISGALLSTWHPPSGVDQETAETSKSFIEEVLTGGSLL